MVFANIVQQLIRSRSLPVVKPEKMRKPRKAVALNNLKLDDIKASFSKLVPVQELQVLADLALFVSFHAQAECGSNPCDIAAAYKNLCAFNDLQVALVKRIRRLVAAQQDLLPPAAFLDQLFQEATRAGIGSELASVFQRCLAEGSSIVV